MKKQELSSSVVILMGPQGSGKGTQAKLLVSKYDFYHIETGALLRQAAKQPDHTGQLLKKAMLKGGLVPAKLAEKVVGEAIARAQDKQIIIDGSPRQLVEAYALEKTLRRFGRRIGLIVFIDIPEEESMKRLRQRQRSDDTEAAIKKRLTWTKTKMSKAVDYFSDHYPVIHVDGLRPVDKVYRDLEGLLYQYGILFKR